MVWTWERWRDGQRDSYEQFEVKQPNLTTEDSSPFHAIRLQAIHDAEWAHFEITTLIEQEEDQSEEEE